MELISWVTADSPACVLPCPRLSVCSTVVASQKQDWHHHRSPNRLILQAVIHIPEKKKKSKNLQFQCQTGWQRSLWPVQLFSLGGWPAFTNTRFGVVAGFGPKHCGLPTSSFTQPHRTSPACADPSILPVWAVLQKYATRNRAEVSENPLTGQFLQGWPFLIIFDPLPVTYSKL